MCMAYPTAFHKFHLCLGSFEEPARERISHIQDTADFNTQLSIVSVVGKRGAGKSTVTSLLSGNCTMFTVSIRCESQFGTCAKINDILSLCF